MPMKLLIVDDSDLVRASLRRLLGSVAGIASIHEAATLGEALDSVRRESPSLVILDLNLPDGLGMNIITQLKQHLPSVRIVVLTIYADFGYQQRCLALGADWFLDKATDIDLLLDVVCQLAAA